MPRCYLVGEEEYKSKDLCRQISLICKEMKISQADLGLKLGVTQARMSQKLKNGDIDIIDLLKVIKILSIRVTMEEGRIRIERNEEDGFDICNSMEYLPGHGGGRNGGGVKR